MIEETGYQPSTQAQMLRTKKTKLVGVVLPKINSDTISREVAGISDVLAKRGYQIILANTNNDIEEELKSLSLFRDNQVDGVIFIATMFTRKHKQMLKEYKVPIVILGQWLEGYPCVYQDDYYASYMITEKLLEKRSERGIYRGYRQRRSSWSKNGAKDLRLLFIRKRFLLCPSE